MIKKKTKLKALLKRAGTKGTASIIINIAKLGTLNIQGGRQSKQLATPKGKQYVDVGWRPSPI